MKSSRKHQGPSQTDCEVRGSAQPPGPARSGAQPTKHGGLGERLLPARCPCSALDPICVWVCIFTGPRGSGFMLGQPLGWDAQVGSLQRSPQYQERDKQQSLWTSAQPRLGGRKEVGGRSAASGQMRGAPSFRERGFSPRGRAKRGRIPLRGRGLTGAKQGGRVPAKLSEVYEEAPVPTKKQDGRGQAAGQGCPRTGQSPVTWGHGGCTGQAGRVCHCCWVGPRGAGTHTERRQMTETRTDPPPQKQRLEGKKGGKQDPEQVRGSPPSPHYRSQHRSQWFGDALNRGDADASGSRGPGESP